MLNAALGHYMIFLFPQKEKFSLKINAQGRIARFCFLISFYIQLHYLHQHKRTKLETHLTKVMYSYSGSSRCISVFDIKFCVVCVFQIKILFKGNFISELQHQHHQ